MNTFVYNDKEVSRFTSSFEKPYWVHRHTDDQVLVEYRSYLQNKCMPFVIYEGVLYGAGPISMYPTNAGVYREYYKVSEGDFKSIHHSTVYDFDVDIAISKTLVNGTSSVVSVLVPLPGKPAVLDASMIGTEWWINRVNVPEKYRRKGVARHMMNKAISKINSIGATGIIVQPGGYDMDNDKQREFYRECGFVDTHDGMKYLFKK